MITLIENKEMTFAEYLANHPHLYDGIDLTGAEIEKINRHFWEYTLKEKTFSHHFLEKLDNALERYHKMKSIEFIDDINKITTLKEITNIAGHIASNGSQTNIGNSNTTNTIGARHSEIKNKDANKQLPMKSNGEDFDEIINWENGASNIEENHNETDTRSATDGISSSDSRTLTNLATEWNTNDKTREVVRGQIANLIQNIWNYYSKPKAIQWLFQQLETSFILIL